MSQKVGAKTKGWIKNLETGKKKSFQFNPEAFGYSRSTTYSEIISPGMAYPNTQFVHGDARTFSVDLFFYDKPWTKVINDYMDFISEFLTPEENKAGYKKPPEMTFCYGYFIKRCVLESLDIAIQEWDKNGHPVQAYFTLHLRQVGV